MQSIYPYRYKEELKSSSLYREEYRRVQTIHMILPHTTNKQKEILLLLYKFRFLNRIQIQTLLNHKHHKTINLWLKDLTEKDYVKRIYEKTFHGMTIPAKYYISLQGIRFLKTQEDCNKKYLKKLYQENRRSKEFISTCLLIADIYFSLQEKSKEDSTEFQFFTPSGYTENSIAQELAASFAYIITSKKTKHIYMCELFRENMPRYAIRGKIKRYIEFHQNEELHGTLIFICPNNITSRFVKRFTRHFIDEEGGGENVTIYVTSYEEMKKGNIGEEVELDD